MLMLAVCCGIAPSRQSRTNILILVLGLDTRRLKANGQRYGPLHLDAAGLVHTHRTAIGEDDVQPPCPAWIEERPGGEVTDGRSYFRAKLVFDGWHVGVELASGGGALSRERRTGQLVWWKMHWSCWDERRM